MEIQELYDIKEEGDSKVTFGHPQTSFLVIVEEQR